MVSNVQVMSRGWLTAIGSSVGSLSEAIVAWYRYAACYAAGVLRNRPQWHFGNTPVRAEIVSMLGLKRGRNGDN